MRSHMAYEQALHLGESREVTRELHRKDTFHHSLARFLATRFPRRTWRACSQIVIFHPAFRAVQNFIRREQFLTFGQFPGTSWPHPNPRRPFRSVVIQEIIFLLCFKIPVAINILLLRCKIFI